MVRKRYEKVRKRYEKPIYSTFLVRKRYGIGTVLVRNKVIDSNIRTIFVPFSYHIYHIWHVCHENLSDNGYVRTIFVPFSTYQKKQILIWSRFSYHFSTILVPWPFLCSTFFVPFFLHLVPFSYQNALFQKRVVPFSYPHSRSYFTRTTFVPISYQFRTTSVPIILTQLWT